MSEEFQVRFDNYQDALQAASSLQTLNVSGSSLLRIDLRGKEIYTGCSIHGQLPPEAVISLGSERKGEFFKVFYQSEGLKSGMHHRDGLLWIRRPDRSHAVHAEKVSLRTIAPTILALLQVRQPDAMTCEPLFPQ
jgi:hypothetical protein